MVAIERVERRLEVLNSLTNNTGKKKKLSTAKQREVRDLGAELAYHQHLLEQARATIAEAENRNRALQEDRAVAEEQLQSAATAVVAANADRDRNIIQANAFASSTIAAAGAQVSAAQSENASLQSRIDALVREENNLRNQ